MDPKKTLELLRTAHRLGRVLQHEADAAGRSRELAACIAAGDLRRIARDVFSLTAAGYIEMRKIEAALTGIADAPISPFVSELEVFGAGEVYFSGERVPPGRYRVTLERIK